MGKRRRLQTDLVVVDDYTSVTTVGVHGTDLSSTQTAEGRTRQRAKDLGKEKKGV